VLENCKPALPEPPSLAPLVASLDDYDFVFSAEGVSA